MQTISPQIPSKDSHRTRPPIFTVGYEGRTIGEFLDLLTSWKISAVIDIRHRAFSRKRDFCKIQLSEALAKHEISYFHLPQFGVPKDVRDTYYQQKDRRILQRFLKTSLDQYHHLLTQILAEFSGRNVCLLCMEKDAAHCHRSIVAEYLAEHGDLNIHHL